MSAAMTEPAVHVLSGKEGSERPSRTDDPFVGRLTCSVAEACVVSGLGRTKIYALIAEGCLKSTAVGRRRLIDVRSLRQLLAPL